MCGIGMFFARESVPDYKYIDKLFQQTENRGVDGFGYIHYKFVRNYQNSDRKLHNIFRSPVKYSKCSLNVKQQLEGNISIGDLIICISRAAPETETNTDINNIEKTMQPILWEEDRICCVHNGAVTNQIYLELKNEFEFKTDIDSEAILASYIKHGKNIKDTCEYLSGGYAAILYDNKKDMVYYWTDFKPLAHAYIKGVGYFLSSELEGLNEIIFDITDCQRNGVNVWENYYSHFLSGQRIKEFDLQCGFVKNIKYSPRFITQNWDSNKGTN